MAAICGPRGARKAVQGRKMMLIVALACLLSGAAAYYIPGAYPQEFYAADVLNVYVNSLTSFDTEMPFEYYTMPFCKPPEGVRRVANQANLGTILQGLRIENSPYNFTVMTKELGKNACGQDGAAPALTADQAKMVKSKINSKYRVNMILDNLPVTVYDLQNDNEFVRPGFELGYVDGGKYYIYNHLRFNVLVHPTHGEYLRARQGLEGAIGNVDARRRLMAAAGGAEGGAEAEREVVPVDSPLGRRLMQAAAGQQRMPTPGEQLYMVVGFEVQPCSIKRKAGAAIQDLDCGIDADNPPLPQEIAEGEQIVYSYDVYWQVSDTKWASRWDAYLRMPGGKVHWFSILNSLLIVLVMASLVATILIRTVRRDLAKYEQLMVDGSVDMKEEAGWKLLTGDVFRAPASPKRLCVYVGTGTQVICVGTVTLLLATLGFLSPASRGALLTTTMMIYVFMSLIAGAVAVFLWGQIERSYTGWVGVALHVSVFFPGILMLIFTVLNIFIKHTGSTGAVPVGIYFTIVAIWFLISIPLTFVGGYLATRAPIFDYPVKTNQIPRQIPPAPLVAHPILLFFSAGVLPFGTMFIELYFAMTSVWLGFFYYLFFFVLAVGVLTVLINIEISVLCTYVQLCAEDYLWWWRSFYRGGSVSLYVALYSVSFLTGTLHNLTGFLPILVYFSYMSIFIVGLFFAMGTVGFVSSGAFVYYIMAAVKAE
ncbi:MAG: Endomembrane protein 70-domain-containing protein [Monoraphidium minutum]|nr:MAG: Endomembrane protein 70-domain-containing protein [Monoraphidium minutum]